MKKSLVSALTTALVVGAASTTFAAANPFSDVAADHWAYDAVAQLAQEGIVNGYADSSFQGDTTMTRYEMAQIVAKAMAKQDTVNASQKAMIDKLAAEFSDELANLGVRVAALESKTDNVTWTGWARYQYKYTNEEKANGGVDNQKFHIRMNVAYAVNDNWTAYSRLRVDQDMNKNDRTNDDGTFDRAWAQGEYDNLTIRVGKFENFSKPTHGMVMEKTISGASVEFGKVVKVQLLGGRTDMSNIFGYKTGDPEKKATEKANMMGAELTVVADKLDAGVGYYNYAGLTKKGSDATLTQEVLADNEDKMGIWGVGVGYKFTNKLYANVDYARANGLKDDFKTDYRAQVTYGIADINKPGSFDVALQYRKRGVMSSLGNQGDWAVGADKGWALITNIVLDKNIKTELAYYQGKDFVSNEKNKAFWGQLQFAF